MIRVAAQCVAVCSSGSSAPSPTSRAVSLATNRLGAALILAERELARFLLNSCAVHALDEPAPRQHKDPLRRWILSCQSAARISGGSLDQFAP